MPARTRTDRGRIRDPLLSLIDRITVAAEAQPHADAFAIAERAAAALVTELDAVRADVWRFEGRRCVPLAGAGVSVRSLGSLPVASIRAVRDGSTAIVDLSDPGHRAGAGWRALTESAGATTISVHPLMAGAEVIGALSVVSTSQPRPVEVEAISFCARDIGSSIQRSVQARAMEDAALLLHLQSRMLREFADQSDVESLRASMSLLMDELVPGARIVLLAYDSAHRLHAPPVGSIGDARWRLVGAHERELLAPATASSCPVQLHRAAMGSIEAWHDLGLATRDGAEPDGTTSIWGVHLDAGHDAVGILLASVDVSDPATEGVAIERTRAALELMASPATFALKHALIEERERIRSSRLARTNELAAAIGHSETFTDVLQELTTGASALLEYPRISAYDCNNVCIIELGTSSSSSLNRERSLVATAFHRRRPSRVERRDRTCHAVPLMCADEIHAVLYVEQPDTVTPEQQADEFALLTSLCEHAAARLLAHHMSEQIERNYKDTIQALVHALEARDRYTADHADAVAEWALETGRRLGMDDEALRDLELGAILHDIGKVAIPDDILNKPGRLTAEEFELMKSHTVVGERILAPIAFLKNVAPIVRHEHERWDGQGYPDGIEGDMIPLASRIIFVCDAYHAITSDRPYREGQPHAFARRIISENAETQFDPAVVSVFLDVIDQWCLERGIIDLGEEVGIEIVNPLGSRRQADPEAGQAAA